MAKGLQILETIYMQRDYFISCLFSATTTVMAALTDDEVKDIQDWLNSRKETTFRWGTRMLRGGQRHYSPCVLDRPGWENFYLTLPYDYDVRNDKVFNTSYSTYRRLGDLGFKWPEPTTCEALRTGICGPDKHAVSRPAFLRSRVNDKRPEPAYRLHLQDRTNLHYLSADPLEGVLPYGRQGDMLKAKSVMHRDYKWRRRCCPPPPEKPTYEREVHRYAQTDIQKGVLPDQVVKFDDDPHMSNYYKSPLVKLKKAYHWPINPITEEALGGRLCYHYPDECMKNRADIWPRGENRIMEPYPIQIPRDRCQVLAHKPKERRESVCCMDPSANMLAYLKTRFPQPNWECWEEVPDSCKRDLPSECCFYEAKTKGPDQVEQLQCPPKGPCPSLYAYK